MYWPRVGVVGVRLIGGSFAAAIKQGKLAGQVIGFAPDATSAEALRLGLIDQVENDLPRLAASVDLLVLAAPVLQIPNLMSIIGRHLGAHTVLTDCASTKKSVIAAAEQYLGDAFARFVPAHPIAGAEKSGPSAARGDLFNGARVIFCPQARTGPAALDQVRRTWQAIGARIAEIDADQHDRLFAVVSHWPHALVFALCAAIARSDVSVKAQQAAGAGLRDTTRIGASSASLWSEILLDNRTEVLRAAEEFLVEAQETVRLLRAGDGDGLKLLFETASQWRSAVEEPTKLKAGA